MLQKIINQFGTTLYVQIWENRIKVTDVVSGDSFDEKPLVAVRTTMKGSKEIHSVGNDAIFTVGNNIEIINPFSHPRVLFSDFTVGEKLLQHVFRKLLGNRLFSTSPRVVVHPMEKIEGGLTMIETRAFRELAFGAGARESLVYQGEEISIEEFDYDAIKFESSESRGQNT